ncbi:MAG: SdrD B-like domain-containing protein [Actinomycetaceae bacterium]|nr:SdrD B-like domain-containing protein [Actinomycetaceae bacterium]
MTGSLRSKNPKGRIFPAFLSLMVTFLGSSTLSLSYSPIAHAEDGTNSSGHTTITDITVEKYNTDSGEIYADAPKGGDTTKVTWAWSTNGVNPAPGQQFALVLPKELDHYQKGLSFRLAWTDATTKFTYDIAECVPNAAGAGGPARIDCTYLSDAAAGGRGLESAIQQNTDLHGSAWFIARVDKAASTLTSDSLTFGFDDPATGATVDKEITAKVAGEASGNGSAPTERPWAQPKEITKSAGSVEITEDIPRIWWSTDFTAATYNTATGAAPDAPLKEVSFTDTLGPGQVFDSEIYIAWMSSEEYPKGERKVDASGNVLLDANGNPSAHDGDVDDRSTGRVVLGHCAPNGTVATGVDTDWERSVAGDPTITCEWNAEKTEVKVKLAQKGEATFTANSNYRIYYRTQLLNEAGTPGVVDGQTYTNTLTLPSGFAVAAERTFRVRAGGEAHLRRAKVSVGDFVWHDLNRDGLQGKDEPGMGGVVVMIKRTDGQQVKNAAGAPVYSTTTDNKGAYRFSDLEVLPKDVSYVVSVTDPSGYTPTTDVGSDPARNSSRGQATAAALTKDGDSDQTLDFGFVRQKVRVGDYVWKDINRDGIQDPGEPGVPGVVLELVGPDGKAVTNVHGKAVGQVKTDGDGGYSFTDLPGLPEGKHYTVKLVKAPAGLIPTIANQGGDRSKDSATGSAESTDMYTDNALDPTLDFGFVQPKVSVGDVVWEDLDADGIQDPGEPGIPGVTVEVRGPDGESVVNVNGERVGAVKTDQYGKYVFNFLPAMAKGQTYRVIVAAPQGYSPTVAGAGSDRGVDSSSVSADSGDLLKDGDHDGGLDFGFVKGAGVGAGGPSVTHLGSGGSHSAGTNGGVIPGSGPSVKSLGGSSSSGRTGALAVTGATTGIIMGVAAVVLVVGAGAFWLSRRGK